MSKYRILLTIIFISLTYCSYGQIKEIEEMWKHQDADGRDFTKPMYLEMDEEKILDLIDGMPAFAMYKDNYFITGVPTNKTINEHTADAKFQFSIRHRLTKTILPYNTFLMLTYTQKSFWDIYEESSPFGDSNYNPGLALVKPLIHNNQLRGMASFAYEHESNGKDSIDSRAWDYFVLSGSYFFNRYFSIQSKIWFGFLGDENDDLYDYRGFGMLALNYRSRNDRIWVSAVINPRKEFWNINTQFEISYKLTPRANQYLFLQWYQGYGESLLDYNRYSSMVRIGLCIKPTLRNLY